LTSKIGYANIHFQESQVKPTPLKKIFLFSSNFTYWAIGLAGCILSGLVTPFFALVYAQIFSVFSEPVEQLEPDARFWSLMFVVIGLLSALGFFTSVGFQTKSNK
jgi:hypothetical protein